MSMPPTMSPADAAAERERERVRAEVERLRTELKAAQAQAARLEALAHEDELTDLLNRRGFLRDLNRAIAFASRYEVPAALLLLDLDAFKPVNDTYGHITGDRALRHVADILRSRVRASDSVARLGGDEFALIIWHVDADTPRHKAAYLEEAVAGAPLVIGAATLDLAASVGATLLQRDEAADVALARADGAMYARKRERQAMMSGVS
jgi:diguanylate cyclase (GGDEF)-like protein